MKSAKKLGVFVFGITSAVVSSAVTTSAYIPAAQAEPIITYVDPVDPSAPQAPAAPITPNEALDPTVDPNYFVDPRNLVVNGDFEDDPFIDAASGKRNPFLTGWTNDSSFSAGSYSDRLDNYANTGLLSLRLAGTPQSGGTAFLSQILDTVVGEEYKLSYFLASVEEAPRLQNLFQTFVGGNLIDTKTNVSYQPFTKYEYNFVAASTSTELKFGSQVRYDYLNLDDVKVKAVNAPFSASRIANFSTITNTASVKDVPEPSIFGGIGVAALMGMWLKRKQLVRKNG